MSYFDPFDERNEKDGRLVTILLWVLIAIVACCPPAKSQTSVGQLTVYDIADFSGATRTLIWKKGTSLPATCTVGDSYFKTDATAGQNLYGCTGTNTWTALGGGGGNALTSQPLSQFAATTSAQLRGVISDETGTGAAVFGTSPSLTTPSVAGMTGTGTIDFASASRTAPMQTGSAAPTQNCTAGDTYFRTSGVTAGQNLYLCTATNTWTQLTGTGSGLPDPGSNGIVARTGAGTTAARTITAGTGVTVTNGDGASANPTVAADTAVLMTKAAAQSGAVWYGTTGGTSTAYTLALTPTLTGYVDGMLVRAKLHTANGTAPTINVDTVGGKPIYVRNGPTVPVVVQSGQLTTTVYDFVYTTASDVNGGAGAWLVDTSWIFASSSAIAVSCNGGLCLGSLNPVSTTSGTSATLAGPSAFYVCTSTCTVTLPVPVAGYQFCVLNGNNVSTVITLAALGSSAMYENTARTAYGTAGTGTLVSGGAAADKVCLLGLDSTHYLTVGYQGTWTAN